MAKKTKKEEVPALNAADRITLIHLLQEQVCLLKDKNKRLEIRLKALESKLSKNSSNSSKPPSSDKHNSGTPRGVYIPEVKVLTGKRNPKHPESSFELMEATT